MRTILLLFIFCSCNKHTRDLFPNKPASAYDNHVLQWVDVCSENVMIGNVDTGWISKEDTTIDTPEWDDDEEFDNEVFLKIQDIQERKIKVNDGLNEAKGIYARNKHKEKNSKQISRFEYEAQYRIGQDGYYVTPEMDMQAYQSASLATAQSTNTWTELGPTYWNRTSGWNPGVGLVKAVSVNPNDTLDILAGSSGGGVWRTRDGGITWLPKTDNNAGWTQILQINRNPNNYNDVWVNIYTGGVIHSTDGGDTWSAITSTFWQSTKKTLILPNGVVFVSDAAGLKKSLDNGASWQQVMTGSKEDIEYIPNNPSIMLVSGNGSSVDGTQPLYRSTDGGTTWNAINLNTYGRTLIATCPAAPNVVYVCQAYGNDFGRLLKSTNYGASYDTLVTRATRNFFNYSNTGTGSGGQATYDMTLTVNPKNPDEVWLGGIHQWRSMDGGVTWKLMTYWSLPNSYGYNHPDQHSFDYNTGKPYTGSDGGIYKFDTTYKDAVTGYWHDISKGLGVRQFYRIYGNKNVISGGAQDNGSSFYKNGQWRDWLGADGMDGVIFNDTTWIGTSQYGTLYKTINGGTSYGGKIGTYTGTGWWVTPLKLFNGTLYTGHGCINKSTDMGATFSLLGDTSKFKGGISYNIDVSYDGSIVYGATSGYLIRVVNNVTDTFRLVINCYWVTTFPDNPLHIRIVTANNIQKILESFDGGKTYTNITYNFPALNPRSATLDTVTGNYYVGTNAGIYLLQKGSTSWVNYTYNMSLVPVNDVDIINGTLYAATYGRGLWSIPLDTTQVVVTNQPPTVNAGADQTVYISRNATQASITLNGNISDDNIGFSSYWKDISANTTYPSQTTSQNNLLVQKPKGSFPFELVATDAGGLIARDTVNVTVLDTNTYVQNPSTSVSLSGGKVGKNGVSLSWQTSVTNDLFIQSILYISVNGGAWQQVSSTPNLSGTYTNSTLASGVNYSYRVVSTSQKSSATSNTIDIKTGGKPNSKVVLFKTPDIIGTKSN